MVTDLINRGQRVARNLGFDVRRVLSAKKDQALYKQLYSADDLENRTFLNIGAGGFSHPFWTNADLASEWYSKLQKNLHVEWDMMSMNPCPVSSDSLNAVYSSCVIEHVSDAAALHMLKEAYRMLKPGGVCRIVAPDAELLYAAYKRRDHHFFTNEHGGDLLLWKDASLEEHFLHSFASQRVRFHPEVRPDLLLDSSEIEQIFSSLSLRDALNKIVGSCSYEIQSRHPGNHINWWSWEKLYEYMIKAGFREAKHSGYGQSCCPVLRNTGYFDNSWSRICFYAEAVKSH